VSLLSGRVSSMDLLTTLGKRRGLDRLGRHGCGSVRSAMPG